MPVGENPSHEALESDMLCPFHYYGVTDISVGGKLLEEDAAFSKLTCPERVKNILAYTRIYGCDHGRTKGLIFCSRVDEAKTLSELLNREGLRTVALDGESTEEAREASIERLEQEDGEDSLDYILTRDIFNEGIDIPCVNQILMLRPTMDSAAMEVEEKPTKQAIPVAGDWLFLLGLSLGVSVLSQKLGGLFPFGKGVGATLVATVSGLLCAMPKSRWGSLMR